MSRSPDWSPWRTLAVGVAVGVCTIAGIGAYTYSEVRRLRDEQTAISERNRKDSLQLLRIQNDLASLAVLMRDMLDRTEPYPLPGWQPAFDRVREDLAEATRLEQELAPAVRDPAQQARLAQSVEAYWQDVAEMFALSRTDEAAARRLVEEHAHPAASRDRRAGVAVPDRQQPGPGGGGARQPRGLRSRRPRDPAAGRRDPDRHRRAGRLGRGLESPRLSGGRRRSTRSFGHCRSGCCGSRRTFSARSRASCTTTSGRS